MKERNHVTDINMKKSNHDSDINMKERNHVTNIICPFRMLCAYLRSGFSHICYFKKSEQLFYETIVYFIILNSLHREFHNECAIK